MLALSSTVLVFKTVGRYLQHKSAPAKNWPGDAKFWTLLLATWVSGVVLQVNCLRVIRDMYGSEYSYYSSFGESFWPGVLWAFLCVTTLALWLLKRWKSGRLPAKSWGVTWFLAAACLISVIAMAICRSQFVAEICSQYQ
jgi:hypothetical protein